MRHADTARHSTTTRQHDTARHECDLRLATGNGQLATGNWAAKPGRAASTKFHQALTHTHTDTHQPGGMWGRGWRSRVEGGTQGLARRTTATPPSFRAPLVVSFSLTRRHPSSIDSLTACSLTCSLSLYRSLSLSLSLSYSCFSRLPFVSLSASPFPFSLCLWLPCSDRSSLAFPPPSPLADDDEVFLLNENTLFALSVL